MCSSCHKEGGCSGCSDVMTVTANNAAGASAGDFVEVSSPTSQTMLYAFLVFILPLLAAFAGYFLGSLVTRALAYVFSVLGIALVFVCLVLVFEVKKKKNPVSVTRIIGRAISEVGCDAVLSEKETVE